MQILKFTRSLHSKILVYKVGDKIKQFEAPASVSYDELVKIVTKLETVEKTVEKPKTVVKVKPQIKKPTDKLEE